MMSQSLLKHVSSLLYERRVWISDGWSPQKWVSGKFKKIFFFIFWYSAYFWWFLEVPHCFLNTLLWNRQIVLCTYINGKKYFVQSAYNPFLHIYYNTYGLYLRPKLKPRYRVCTRFITTQNWRQTTQTNCVTWLLLKLDRIASVDNIQLRIYTGGMLLTY